MGLLWTDDEKPRGRFIAGTAQYEKRWYGMKKSLVLAVALLLMLPISAMAGMTAFMDMDELSSGEMASTQGQAGITLRAEVSIVTGGYIAWGDDDGCTKTINPAKQGWLTLASVWSDKTTLTDVTVDVCTGEDGKSWLVLYVPSLTVNQGIRAIKVGSLVNTGPSLGELRIANLTYDKVSIRVTGH